MKKWLSRLFIGLLAVLVVLSVLPFAIHIREDGIAPSQLVNDPDGRFISLQGINVYYEDKGDSAAPALLLVHGLFGSTETWRYNVDALVDADYRVITFDRPGFGLSDKLETTNYSVDNQTDLMVQLLDALSIKTTIIIGHSAGGNVAAHFAVNHPDRTAQLVLVDAAVLAGGPPGFVGKIVSLPSVWRWGRIGLQAYFTRENFEKALQGFYVNPSFMTEADYDVYWRTFQTPGWDIGLLGLTRDGGSPLTQVEIGQITVKTLLLWGEQDTTTPLSQAKTLAQWLPNSLLTVIPNVGHQAFEEAPEAFNTALIAFLNEGG